MPNDQPPDDWSRLDMGGDLQGGGLLLSVPAAGLSTPLMSSFCVPDHPQQPLPYVSSALAFARKHLYGYVFVWFDHPFIHK